MSIIFFPLKTLPRSSKSCDFVTFGVLRYLLSPFLLYTPHCHMILSKQKCCLLSTGVSTESKTYLCTSIKARFFSNKKYDSYKYWSCAELCEAFTFLMENIYVQFDGMIYQQLVGIPMGTNCAPLSRFIFILLREGLYVWPSKVETFWPHGYVQRYLSISWRYFHHR